MILIFEANLSVLLYLHFLLILAHTCQTLSEDYNIVNLTSSIQIGYDWSRRSLEIGSANQSTGKKPMMKALSISKSRYVKKFLVQPKQKKHCPILSYLKMGFSYTVTIVCVCMYFSKTKTQWVRNWQKKCNCNSNSKSGILCFQKSKY